MAGEMRGKALQAEGASFCDGKDARKNQASVGVKRLSVAWAWSRKREVMLGQSQMDKVLKCHLWTLTLEGKISEWLHGFCGQAPRPTSSSHKYLVSTYCVPGTRRRLNGPPAFKATV